jgi:hypothetical protein
VRLDDPSRDPTRVVELDNEGDETAIGGGVAVAAIDEPGDRQSVRLKVDVARPGNDELRIDGVTLDRGRRVVIDAPTQSLGHVKIALWGHCDVRDASGDLVARRRPVRVWVGDGGDAHVDVDGVVRLVVRP